MTLPRRPPRNPNSKLIVFGVNKQIVFINHRQQLQQLCSGDNSDSYNSLRNLLQTMGH